MDSDQLSFDLDLPSESSSPNAATPAHAEEASVTLSAPSTDSATPETSSQGDLSIADATVQEQSASTHASNDAAQLPSATEELDESSEETENELEVPSEEMKAIFGRSWDGIEHFAHMIADEGELRGLIGPRELPRLYSRHLVNCTAVESFLPRNCSVADLGSGTGLPGIVLALMRPDLDIHLIETLTRRCEWLDDCVTELGLDNVVIHQARAEELGGILKVDRVTARAVAHLTKLIRWSFPLLKTGGDLVALKGRKAQEEMTKAGTLASEFPIKDMSLHELDLPGSDEPTRVITLTKGQSLGSNPTTRKTRQADQRGGRARQKSQGGNYRSRGNRSHRGNSTPERSRRQSRGGESDSRKPEGRTQSRNKWQRRG